MWSPESSFLLGSAAAATPLTALPRDSSPPGSSLQPPVRPSHLLQRTRRYVRAGWCCRAELVLAQGLWATLNCPKPLAGGPAALAVGGVSALGTGLD